MSRTASHLHSKGFTNVDSVGFVQDVTSIGTSGPLSGQTPSTLKLHFKDSWRVGPGANYQLTQQ
jgi:hypothetical protein